MLPEIGNENHENKKKPHYNWDKDYKVEQWIQIGAQEIRTRVMLGEEDTAGHNETVALLWVLVPAQTWVCKIYISSRELEAILLNHKQEKYLKEVMMSIKIDIFDVRPA